MNSPDTRVKLPVVVLALTCGAMPTLAAPKVVMNGKVASSDVRVINGSPYVKLADVVKAFGMVVVKRGDGYEIKKPGGATPIKGVLRGKIGDVLFDGKWRFQALGVQQPQSYTMKTHSPPDYAIYSQIANYDPTTRVFGPKAGFKLVAIPCRLTNGRNEKVALWIGSNHNNSLADFEGSSHTAIGYDFDGAPIQSKDLLPGAKLDFVVLFSVPESTRIKDFIFTLQTIRDNPKGNDVRVSLQNAPQP